MKWLPKNLLGGGGGGGLEPLFQPPPPWRARTNGAAAPHPGTFPGRSQGREALSAPWDPSTCHQRPRPWECGTQLVQQRHLCQQAVKERGSPPVVPGAHPSPCVRSRGTGRQRVSVTRRMRCPGPLLPGGLSVRLPWPAPPGLEHQATLAPHTQGPAPAHTPARARAYTQDDGIFRPPALRWGLVAVDSPLGLGTGQSGCSASWWGREGSPHPRACSCMRPLAQPNPTPLGGGSKGRLSFYLSVCAYFQSPQNRDPLGISWWALNSSWDFLVGSK